MANLVDGALLWFRQLARGRVDGVFFEKEADLVARVEKVVVSDVVGAVVATGGEAGHGVRGEVKASEEGVCLCEEAGGGGGAEDVGEDEVAVAVEGGELGGGEALLVGGW